MALRLEMVFGLRMETLMEMQTAYEVARARRWASKIQLNRFSP
jgi:plasmid maintenance system antidote protein VapI